VYLALRVLRLILIATVLQSTWADLQKTEVTIGSVLIAVSMGPVALVIIYLSIAATMPLLATFGPTGLTAHDEGCLEGLCSRVQVQFMQFWFLISFFLLGIGIWFLISGLESKAIISKTKA